MHHVSRWLPTGRLHTSSSAQSLDSLAESQNLESALRAVELILDDDIEGAETGLSQGNSAFHSLCRGVIGFMKATLGFEQEIMREASQQLSAAETSASSDLSRAQKNTGSFHSSIYDKGSEFALCQAEAQIMGAVVAVLNESLTESIKGFYKLRKAYQALDGLMQMETIFVKTRGVPSLASSRRQSSESLRSNKSSKVHATNHSKPINAVSERPREEAHANQPSGLRQAETAGNDASDSEDSEEFYEVNDIHDERKITTSYTGRFETSRDSSPPIEKMSGLSMSDQTHPGSSSFVAAKPSNTYDMLTADPDDPVFSSTLDIFIHSGTNLCFGLLSLLISAIPPAFSKLLYIIGFRGDRERGMRMLWQASKFSNINGGMAGLTILGWYNGLVGFCDIIPDTDPSNQEDQIEGFPAKRLEALLAEMRRRYPKSHLWLIEEARMAASRRKLDVALDLLSQPGKKTQLKQLEALHMFEKSLQSMDAHRYQLCADSFLACVDLNSWSQALYYYIAAAAHLSIYRDLKSELVSESSARSKTEVGKLIAKHGKLAEEYFRTAPTKTGKKKMMGRQLPFDTFVNRKIAKWTARADAWSCDFIDAVGVSPLEEMILLWNGYKKMNREQLETSLQNLAWSESPINPHWEREDLDEHAIQALLQAVVYRNLRQHEKAKHILRSEILCHDAHAFKGLNRDDWTAPTAHYEYAVNLWMERTGYVRLHGTGLVDPDSTGLEDGEIPLDLPGDAKLVQEAKAWIEKAKLWEKYELDARIGMKVTAAWDAVKKWEERNSRKATR